MCKIVLGNQDHPIKVNGTKVYLPLSTRKALMNSTTIIQNNVQKTYHHHLRTGKIGITDPLGGITIPIKDWEEMVNSLKLILINLKKEDKIINLPAIAS